MKIVTNDNGLFVLRGCQKPTKVAKDSDSELLASAAMEEGNFIAKLYYSDYLMNNSCVEDACQLRLDASIELLQSIDEEDEIEFDMSDINTSSAVKIMALSAIDHFQICDFEMAVSLAETALELNPEDTEGMINVLGYSYAMLGDRSAVEDIMPFLQVEKLENELIMALLSYKEGNVVKVSDELKLSLNDEKSKLSQKFSHLWLAAPDFLNTIN